MDLLVSSLEKFPQTKILCVGDIMLDCFLYGAVERISPEAPVAVVKKKEEKFMLGGAGNVAANLASLSAKTYFVGVVGEDEAGSQIETFLQEKGVYPMLVKVRGYQTTLKTRFVASHHHLLRVDKEEALDMTAELQLEVLSQVSSILEDVDIVLLSDYNKGVFCPEFTQKLIALCKQYGKQVIVDPKGADYSQYAGATLVKPNLKEFELATGVKVAAGEAGMEASLVEGAGILFSQYGIENLIVTLSEHGMIFIPGESPELYKLIPTQAKDVFDVSGAGDTSLAALGIALATGAKMAEAMQLANRASGIVVGKFGTAQITLEELREVIVSDKWEKPWQKRYNILTLSEAKKEIDKLKGQNKKIGFTNGCFDLLHMGHLQSFMRAKQACDVLVVGLNSDASIRRLKGQDRPINSEEMRSFLLSSLEYIDYVVIFEEDTALPLIEYLRPDVIAKEGYALEDWPEGQYVQSYGGTVVELPRLEGFSTSQLVEKLRQSCQS